VFCDVDCYERGDVQFYESVWPPWTEEQLKVFEGVRGPVMDDWVRLTGCV